MDAGHFNPWLFVLFTRRSSSLLQTHTHRGTYTLAINITWIRSLQYLYRCMKDRAHNICAHNQRSKNCTTWRRSSGRMAFLLDLWRRLCQHHPRNLVHRHHSPSHYRRSCAPLLFEAGVSEKLKKICTSLNIHTIFKPGCTLKQTLIKVKNHVSEEKKKAVVYQVPCKDCQQLYTGESKRTLKVRLAEHKRAVQKSDV